MRTPDPRRERSRHASPRGRLLAASGTAYHRYRSRRLVVDAGVWSAAMALGAALTGASPAHSVVVGILGAVTQSILGFAVGLYRGRWRLGSFDEVVALGVVASSAAILLLTGAVAAGRAGIDLAIGPLAPFAALSGMTGARGLHRWRNDRRLRPRGRSLRPVVVYGAGDGGAKTIRAMLTNPRSPYVPVALLDDDENKANLRIQGVPVLGGRADMATVVAATHAELVIVAIPSATSAVIRSLGEMAARIGVDIRVLPPTHELVAGSVSLSDIREITEADLLGRRAIDTDLHAIADYLTGRKVLVTGAGGSIGSELCRQIARFDPAQLVMLDRDESALHSVQLSLDGRALLDDRNIVVADIRDGARVDEVFAEHAPAVVFHAAALKHLPLLEMYPEEGWKTNVEGTNNVLRAAARVGVDHFVNVSTDKAADPTSVLGYTKRVAERLTAWYANRIRGDWVSVRFGNVLGSRGSVLETFRAQIDAGGPVTVTHPDVSRYFMTPSEACQLVIQAGAVGDRGEALVLDMGRPVRILDVAERLVAASGRQVEIEFTGLRAGEKLHERLVSVGELDIRRSHPLISHTTVPALNPANLGLFDRRSDHSAKSSLIDLCALESGELATPRSAV